RGRPEERAVHYAVLRSLQRAVYSPKEEGHFALASDCYCHFTSPIRRYPDLTIHRLLADLLEKRRPPQKLEELIVLGQHCSDREQRAESAERELTKLKLLAFLSDQIGLEMDAVVTGVENFGLFVQGIELPAEGLIHADALADDYYDFDRATHTLCARRSGNRYRLGDLLRVSVARVDLERRELDFRLVQRKSSSRPAAVAAVKKSSKGGKQQRSGRRRN
ncbi:MAG: RNB domain-containing ribonuclease, partial [Thermoguttaceae bacterium]